jgi:hypothetical protein
VTLLTELNYLCYETGKKYLGRGDMMPRRARLDAPGTLHYLIVRGIEKRRIVNDVGDRKNFVKRLGEL